MEENATLPGHHRHLFHRKEHAGFVVGPHHADQGGVVRQAVLVLLHVQEAFPVHRQGGDAVFAAAQVFEVRTQILDRGVLDPGGDDVRLAGLTLHYRIFLGSFDDFKE